PHAPITRLAPLTTTPPHRSTANRITARSRSRMKISLVVLVHKKSFPLFPLHFHPYTLLIFPAFPPCARVNARIRGPMKKGAINASIECVCAGSHTVVHSCRGRYTGRPEDHPHGRQPHIAKPSRHPALHRARG